MKKVVRRHNFRLKMAANDLNPIGPGSTYLSPK